MKSLRAARIGNFLITVITIASIIYPCIVIIRWENTFSYSSNALSYFVIINCIAICIRIIFDRIDKKLRKCPKCKSEIPIDLLRERKKVLFCPYCKEPLSDGYSKDGTAHTRITHLRAAGLVHFLITIIFIMMVINFNVYAYAVQSDLRVIMCAVFSLVSYYILPIPYNCPKCNNRIPITVVSQKKKDAYCPHCKEKLQYCGKPR